MHHLSRFDRALQKPLRRTGDIPARMHQPARERSLRAAFLGTASLPSLTISGLCLGAAFPIALGMGLAGFSIPASAACLPGATTACSAPGGIGQPGRSGSGGAGNGDGGGASILSGSDTIVVPGDPGSGGNGGKGADGDNPGGLGGNVGFAAGGVTTIGGDRTGGTGNAGPGGFNFGAGGGGGGSGIYFSGSDVMINAGVMVGGGAGGAGGFASSPVGNGGGGGGGGTGIASVIAGATINNRGFITGGAGGDGAGGGFGGGGGGGGDGLMVFGANSIITNIGTITGGIGGSGGIGSNSGPVGSGSSGAGINLAGSGSLILNTGTIIGGAGNNAPAGAGIVGGDVSILNLGTISGGLYSDGITRANAITFTGGTNILEIQGGSAILGNVVANGVNDTLILSGSGNRIFNASDIGIGAQYQGFEHLKKEDSGTWTLTGSANTSADWLVTAGTLSVLSSDALGTGNVVVDGNSLGLLEFVDLGAATSAGARTITLQNDGRASFQAGTNAGTATINITSGTTGGVQFWGDSSAASATINSRASGREANFTNSSNAGNARITNRNGGMTSFWESSSAASATITNDNSGRTFFDNDARAGSATITNTNSGTTYFLGRSSAESSIITNEATGRTYFMSDASGGNAQIVNKAGGLVDISGLTSAGTTFGSITGGGDFQLGSKNLTVGSNNQSTTVSGVISGSGGSLTKTGTGTLTLAGGNTYSGATSVNQGTLRTGSARSLSAASAMTVAAGAMLDLAGFNQEIGSLAGAGDVLLGAGVLTTGRNGSNTTFSGDISGTGGLTKTGTGTLTLTGLNSYDGETVVAAGMLASGAPGAFSALSDVTVSSGATLNIASGDEAIGSLSGAGTVTIAGGAVLTTGLSDKPTTFAGSFLGAGSLEIDGTATAMTLTGNSEIGGNLDICSCGGMNIQGSFKAHGDVMVAGGTLTVERGGQLEGASVEGVGGLTIASGGRVSTPQFAWLGGTVTIMGAGSLLTVDEAQASGGIGHLDLNILDGGRMATTGDMSLLSMTGYGNAAVRGPGSTLSVGGTLVVGDSTIGIPDLNVLTLSDRGRVTAGTIIVGTDGALEIGTGGAGGTVATSRLVNDGALAFNHTDALTFDVPIEGAGSLHKSGSGRLTLTGTSTLSGPTYLQAGQLAVNGSLAASPMTVTGGTVSGTGTVGRLSLQSGGAVAPGNSIGTLNVAGNLSFGPGSFYALEIDGAGRSDRIATTGTATLNGGTVQILPDQGINFLADHPYTILTAQGGRTGTFAGTQSTDFAFITPTLGYAADAVTLTMVRKTVPPTPPAPPVPMAFHTVAVTPNQYHTADAVEALGAGNRLYNTVLGSTVSGARQAFEALSGEAHASAVTTSYEDSRLVREAILTRLRQPLIGSNLPLLAQGTVGAAFAADAPRATPPVAVTPMPVAPRYALWGEGFGAWGQTRSDRNAAALDTSTGGFLIGADALVSDGIRLGLAGGYLRTSFDVDARLSSGANESVFGALYGTGRWGALALRLGASYARHDIDLSRTISFPGYADAVRASYDGATLQAFGELGYRLGFGGLALEPFVGASVLRLTTDTFQEQGGAAALTGFGRSYDLGTTIVGVRAEAQLSADLPLRLSGLLGWRHAVGDVAPEALLAFAGGASAFSVAGVPVDRDALVAQAGLDYRASEALSLGVSYSGQIGERAQEHAVKGNLTWRFGTY